MLDGCLNSSMLCNLIYIEQNRSNYHILLKYSLFMIHAGVTFKFMLAFGGIQNLYGAIHQPVVLPVHKLKS